MNQVIDFSTLTWVKSELDETLKEARQSLEAHVENRQDEAQLGFLAAHLHQVFGTLQMVELYGASLLAEEMEHVAGAIADKSVSKHDDACEVLMRAILQLPDYLDRLIAGYQDIPLVLLPVLNDLRAVRGESLLSENAMFSPDLAAELPESVLGRSVEGDIQKKARELRHHFQLGLLGFFRDQAAGQALASLRDVLEQLMTLSTNNQVAQQWWIAAGVVEALQDGTLESSVSVKRLLGQVDRQIKRVLDEGEPALAVDQSADLLKNLLFYVAQSHGAGTRVTEIQSTYRLHDLLPGEEELAAARESLSGQNTDLFETVAVAVREELGRLKDALDIVLRGGLNDVKALQPLNESLSSLGDTLGMLSLGAARKAVMGKVTELEACLDSGEAPLETTLMDIASTLLFVESSVDRMGQGRKVSSGEPGRVDQQLAESEFDQVTDVVLNEAVADVARAKEAIIEFVDSGHDTEVIGSVPQLFNQVKGSLLLLGETRAASLTDSAARYVDEELIQGAKEPPQQELDSLADAICGLEYYLESRKEHRMYGSSALDVAENSIEKLGYPAEAGEEPEESLDTEGAVPADCEAGTQDSAESAAADPAGMEAQEPAAGDGDDPGEVAPDASLLDESPVFESIDVAGVQEAAADTEALDMLALDDSGSGYDDLVEALSELSDGAGETVEDAGVMRDEAEPEAAGEVQAEVEAEFEAEAEIEVQAVAETAVEAESGAEEETVAEAGEEESLPVLGDEVDEEILEIFIEEAEEELASINEQLPAWVADPGNSDAMATMRRSYHTLKGSGRLVGAMRIGEFAWSYENMLNRLIDGAIEATPPLIGVLEQGCDALQELIQQIKDGSPTGQPIEYLARCAEALSKGEPMPAGSVPAQVEAEPEDIQSDAQEFVAPSADTDQEAETDEVEPAAADAAADQTVNEFVMDELLYDIFSTETAGHLEVIRQFLNAAQAGESGVADELVRALHTLHGSAHMAEANAIAELSGQLEKYSKALLGAGKAMSSCGCNVLNDSVVMIDGIMHELPGEMPDPEGLGDLLDRINVLLESADSCEEGTEASSGEEPVELSDQELAEIVMEESDEAPISGDHTDDDVPAATEVADQPAGEDPYAGCDEELMEIFLEEAQENLEVSDAALHTWRESRDDTEALSELQRALHTLKGGARMADISAVGDLAHAVESLIIAIAEGLAGADEEALDGVQHAQDQLSRMLDSVANRRPIDPADELVARLEALREHGPASETESVEEAGETESVAETFSETTAEPVEAAGSEEKESDPGADPYTDIDPELLEVFLEEAGDILENSEQTLRAWKQEPREQALMVELKRELHTLKGGARMADITEIGDLAHAVESMMAPLTEGTLSASDAMFSVLQSTHDHLVGMIDDVHKRRPVAAADQLVKNLEALREGREISEPVVPARADTKQKSGETEAEPVAVAAASEHKDRRAHVRNNQELVRIRADLLDNMVNTAGEVSIYRSRLEQQIGASRFNLVEMDQTVTRLREQLRKMEIETEAQVLFRYEQEAEQAEDFDPLEMDRYSHMQQLSRSLVESVSDLSSIQNLLENISRESETLLLQQARVNTELQEGLMRTRMVPFLGLAARMRRIVRQTCQELGKKAELELAGAEGEMDRTVIDRIIAPLEHMLRNAISHGIETPAERSKAGKPETGTIRITLKRESSDVVLRIADDGKGIGLEAIRRKAIERGLMKEQDKLSDTEVLQFILETGFSTAEKVTQVAGRGVGMDVVNNEVKQLGGSLHIDSVAGQGTAFVVRLPFTLAINQALLIEVGEDTYAIPLASIEGIVRMRREDLQKYYNDPEARFDYGGFEYEVRHLGSTLGSGKPHLDSGPKRIPVLLSRSGDHCVAWQVENLMGSREIVVKSVGAQISTVRGVSGATILGDGRVVMILDVVALLRGGSVMDQVEEMMQQPVHSQGITVMVVDDSITVRKVTTRLLERNDMNVISAKDGVDAVAKLQDHLPDIMLLDIEMPRMDGFELATHIRNENRLRDIPIIMITSRTGDKHRQRAMEIGVNRYLGKPFQESDLLENIRGLLEEQKVDG